MITQARRRILFSSAAELEIAEAALWYEDHRTGLGQSFLTAVRNAAEAAATSPQLYVRVHGKLRRVLVHRFPYALVFREAHDELLIAACYHLHRDPKVWKSRG